MSDRQPLFVRLITVQCAFEVVVVVEVEVVVMRTSWELRFCNSLSLPLPLSSAHVLGIAFLQFLTVAIAIIIAIVINMRTSWELRFCNSLSLPLSLSSAHVGNCVSAIPYHYHYHYHRQRHQQAHILGIAFPQFHPIAITNHQYQ